MRGRVLTLQEKVDGSQISFGRKNGQLFVKSHNHMINLDLVPKLFTKAVDNLKGLALPDGLVFRGEYLNKPKHNTLTYDRVPLRNIIIYDIEQGDGTCDYMNIDDVEMTASLYGFEVVPTFCQVQIDNITVETEMLDELLKTKSILGGTTIEGIAIKCYDMLDCNEKILMAKYVSSAFKEANHGNSWNANMGKKDTVGEIVAIYNTTARYVKTVSHCKEDGLLVGEMKDLGVLMRALNEDFETECVDEIKDMLYKKFRKNIMRGVSQGFPEWYKNVLIEVNATVTDA
jgi:glutaredoxin 2